MQTDCAFRIQVACRGGAAASSIHVLKLRLSSFIPRLHLIKIFTDQDLVYSMGTSTTSMASALQTIDLVRQEANRLLDPKRKSALGQFMTPSIVAQYMASLFRANPTGTIRLLDPGAGVGSLTAAFLERFTTASGVKQIGVTAYEVDEVMQPYLTSVLNDYRIAAEASGVELHSTVMADDFIDAVCRPLLRSEQPRFTHAILNPPYKKINSDSEHRALLRRVGIETVNLYSAFLALTIDMMEDGGEIVAIVPRSFCNGPYYRPFRDWLFQKTAIWHIHLFEARDRAFQEDEVLQENIIIHLVRSEKQGDITISTSTDHALHNYECNTYQFEQLVKPSDAHRFLHIPSHPKQSGLELSPVVKYSLEEIGIQVSTGPVVDFRLRDYLRSDPGADTVPLLYPAHFAGQGIEWPKQTKKPNALVLHPQTRKWLFPNGFYTVVRRFSSKEERHRIVATVVQPSNFDSDLLGFENHLNVFHIGRCGLPADLAYGLSAFLNSTVVDEAFRSFNGHTQVNATDLRLMKYPSSEALVKLGTWAKEQVSLSQDAIDQRVSRLL
jgi:adenine-specific DNA-methyltransferase